MRVGLVTTRLGSSQPLLFLPDGDAVEVSEVSQNDDFLAQEHGLDRVVHSGPRVWAVCVDGPCQGWRLLARDKSGSRVVIELDGVGQVYQLDRAEDGESFDLRFIQRV
jgi:hypothetical protein